MARRRILTLQKDEKPFIRIGSVILKEAGFVEGIKYTLTIESGKLTLKVITEEPTGEDPTRQDQNAQAQQQAETPKTEAKEGGDCKVCGKKDCICNTKKKKSVKESLQALIHQVVKEELNKKKKEN
jgi:hypothetical protein